MKRALLGILMLWAAPLLAQIGATAVTPTPGELDQLVNANTPDDWDKITREA